MPVFLIDFLGVEISKEFQFRIDGNVFTKVLKGFRIKLPENWEKTKSWSFKWVLGFGWQNSGEVYLGLYVVVVYHLYRNGHWGYWSTFV